MDRKSCFITPHPGFIAATQHKRLQHALSLLGRWWDSGSMRRVTPRFSFLIGGLLLCLLSACASGGISWIEDDYPAALKRSIAEDKPIVIDLWAPWCHTCLSMKHYVLNDPAIEALEDRFVWLALDTDRVANARALTKFPPEVWPTFYVVSGRDQKIQAQFPGSATAQEFIAFLERGETAALANAPLDKNSAAYWLREGSRAAAAKLHNVADKHYALAISLAPKDWARLPDVLGRRIRAQFRQKDYSACGQLALKHMTEAMSARDAAAYTFANYAVLCATRGDQNNEVLREVVSASGLKGVVDDLSSPMTVDDRTDSMRVLRNAYRALEDQAAAKAIAERQATMLTAAFKAASSPKMAMTYNWPRVEVHRYLGRLDELVEDLTQQVSDLPEQYDPPYRLATTLFHLDRLEPAMDMAKRALALVYGPRRRSVEKLMLAIEIRATTSGQ
ncbi:MAG: thiol-disulfide isomerase/thioredoxin [Myxococcota bacterium]|jgi:thiol-disulfide isomerase/thioredoxin